jgi:hypothetical protein
MEKKSIVFTMAIFVSTLILSSQLNAIGLGIYGTASKGEYAWTYHIDEYPNIDVDSDVSKYGLGFVMDTCLAKDNLFNYRLNIGFSRLKIDNENSAPDMKGNEYFFNNSFGFGVFRSEIVRIWLGPQVGFGWISGEYELQSGSTDTENDFWTMFYALGVAAGINFNIEDIITLGVDGGYRYSKHAGIGHMDSISSTSFGLSSTGKEFFANFSIMFRINDVF